MYEAEYHQQRADLAAIRLLVGGQGPIFHGLDQRKYRAHSERAAGSTPQPDGWPLSFEAGES